MAVVVSAVYCWDLLSTSPSSPPSSSPPAVAVCFLILAFQAFPTLKLFREDKLQSPDFAGDRTLDSFSTYLYEKADGVVRRDD